MSHSQNNPNTVCNVETTPSSSDFTNISENNVLQRSNNKKELTKQEEKSSSHDKQLNSLQTHKVGTENSSPLLATHIDSFTRSDAIHDSVAKNNTITENNFKEPTCDPCLIHVCDSKSTSVMNLETEMTKCKPTTAMLFEQNVPLHFRTCLRSHDDALILISGSAPFHIEWVNSSFTRVYGWSLEDIHGLDFQFLHGGKNGGEINTVCSTV